MRHFVERLFSTWTVRRSYDFVESMILKNAFSISSIILNSEIQRLQSTFVVYESALYIYLEILTIFTNKFATSGSADSLKNYLRSCLQLLITYSICSSDNEWTFQKWIAAFEKYAASLEKLLCIPPVSVSSHISLNNCLLRANLLETEAELSLLRVSIIRRLYESSRTIEPRLKFKAFDCTNQNHVRNASDFHKRMKIKSQPCTLISTVFSLAINLSLFTETFFSSPVGEIQTCMPGHLKSI